MVRLVETVIDDLKADGQSGAAAILTQKGSEHWIQFALTSSAEFHFDFPLIDIFSPGFNQPGPWERVQKPPEIPNGEMEIRLPRERFDAIKELLSSRGIEFFSHAQAVFDSEGRPLATSMSFQFNVSTEEPDLPELILKIFEAAHAYRATDLEVERFRIEWD